MTEHEHQHSFAKKRGWPKRIDFCHYEVWKQLCVDQECAEVIEIVKQRQDHELLLFGHPEFCGECKSRMEAAGMHDLVATACGRAPEHAQP